MVVVVPPAATLLLLMLLRGCMLLRCRSSMRLRGRSRLALGELRALLCGRRRRTRLLRCGCGTREALARRTAAMLTEGAWLRGGTRCGLRRRCGGGSAVEAVRLRLRMSLRLRCREALRLGRPAAAEVATRSAVRSSVRFLTAEALRLGTR